MKTNRKIILISAVSILGVVACSITQAASNVGQRIADVVRGSGNLVEEIRAVEDFNSIDLSGVGLVVVEFGSQEALRVEAEDNLIEYIRTEVRNQTLEIGIEENVDILPTEPVRIYVTAVSLDSTTVSGAGDIQIPPLEVSSFEVNLDGVGNTTIEEINAESLEVRIGGSGNVSVNGGEVDTLVAVIEGLGNFDGEDLAAQTAEIEISGAGNATVWVTESIDAVLSGLGNISFYGDPSVSSNRTGLGDISSLGDK